MSSSVSNRKSRRRVYKGDGSFETPTLAALSLVSRSSERSSTRETHGPQVFVLGKRYDPMIDYSTQRADEQSLFWFTYRCDFPTIVPYGISTDAGWGCMLRSAQMMLAQVLRRHYCGRDWAPPKSIIKRRNDPLFRSILTCFADFPSQQDCRYSLHNMVAVGLSRYETLPGEWYGPGTACYVVRDLCMLHEQHREREPAKSFPEGDKPMFRVYVASQGTVYRDAVQDLMTINRRNTKQTVATNSQELTHPLEATEAEDQEEADQWDASLMLLVPLRLGLKSFNETYTRSLAHVFSLRQSVGVLGGKPRGARWFYGASSDGSKLFGLDPHTVQNAPKMRRSKKNVTSVALTEEYIRSVQCMSPDVINLQKVDPSLALGFYFSDRDDFELFCNELTSWRESATDGKPNPEIFSIAAAVPDYTANVSATMNELMSSSCGKSIDMECHLSDGDDEQANLSDEDDYVVL